MNHAQSQPQVDCGPCPSRDQLSDLLLGKLAIEAIDAIGVHVEACAMCQGVLESLDAAEDPMLSDLRGSAGPLAVDPDLERRIRQAETIGSLVWHEPRSATPDEPRPKNLGQYEILERIGRGGMGTVYKAMHTRLKRPVAIKVLPASRLQSAAAVARFHREMEAIGRLDHPNLVRAYDAGEAEGEHFLVMEFLDGIDLARLLRAAGPLRIADACEAVRQTALGLQYVHQNGQVHRDINPSNLMLTREGQIKILDLGLALLKSDQPDLEPVSDDAPPAEPSMTRTGEAMGTTGYMAPEQVANAHAVDIRADIYSLGCTFYKLLSGHSPFSGPQYDTAARRLRGHLHDAPPPLGPLRPDVPPALSAIVERMLAKRAADRFSTPAEVAEAVSPFVAGSDLAKLAADAPANAEHSAETDHAKGRTRVRTDFLIRPKPTDGLGNPSYKKRRWTILLAGAVAVLLAGLMVYHFAANRGERSEIGGRSLAADRDYRALDKTDPATTHQRRGYAYQYTGEADKAIAEFTEVLRLDPQNADARAMRGSAYKDKGQLDRAIGDYTEVIRSHPKSAAAYGDRASAYDANGEFDKAIADCEAALRLDPRFAKAYCSRGYAYGRKGDLGRAIADFTEAVHLDPNYARAYGNRGTAYLKRKDFDRAITDYTEAIRLDPKRAANYEGRGAAFLLCGDLDQAIADYRQAVRLDLSVGALNMRGIAYANRARLSGRSADFELALADFTEALRISPTSAEAHANRGTVYRDQGELDKALADYAEAIRLSPKLAVSYSNRGFAYAKKGELDRAIADYTTAIRLDPRDGRTYISRAIAYHDKGELQKAAADYAAAIALYGDDIRIDPRDATARLNRAIAYQDQGDLDRAIADYTEAIRLSPKLAAAYDGRARAYQAKGERAKAEADFAEVLRLEQEGMRNER